MSREVYLIGCHVENEEQSNLLRRLVSHLNFFKKDYVLVSHTMLPSDIVEKSVGFIYDKCNPVFQSWDIPDSNHWNFYTKDWRIASKYILYGASPYYHVGVLRLLLHGIQFLKTLDYKIVHWIEYDMFPDFDRAEENTKLINEDNDFIFHGIGSFFSYRNDTPIKKEFQESKNHQLLQLLQKNQYVAEAVISNDLFVAKPFNVFNSLKNSGDYSQNFDKVPIHWSLFTEQNNDVHIFLLNKKNRNVIIEYKYNDKCFYKELIPEMYHKVRIGFIEMNNMVFFEIKVDGEVYVNINWMGEEFYEKLIKETRTWKYT
jgi:hypothetical protein